MGVTGLRSAAEIVVEGRVQGVGYRDFVQRKAASLGLAGYVMNLKNGNVRVRVEGGRDLIEELMHDLGKGPPLARVDTWPSPGGPPTGRFTWASPFATRSSTRDGAPRRAHPPRPDLARLHHRISRPAQALEAAGRPLAAADHPGVPTGAPRRPRARRPWIRRPPPVPGPRPGPRCARTPCGAASRSAASRPGTA